VATIVIFPRKKFLPLSLVLFSLTGCIGEVPRTDLAEAPKGITPELQLAPKLPPYRLQVGDVVDVKLMLNPELNDQVVVRPDGMISTMVVGDIKAYGRTVRQVQKDLENGYGKNLTEPRVSLIVRSFAPTRVYVLGEVNAPGEFITVGPSLTLLQAIARSGGVKNSADTSNVIIVRHGAGDTSEAYRASYHDAVTGEDPASDVRLAPYDVVYVPRTGVANAYLNYQQNFQQFLPISGNASAVYEINSSGLR
jgi:polysaccharide biosynthesis/export protein